MLDRDDRKPTETNDVFWIFAANEKNDYNVKKGRSGKWLIFEHEDFLNETWEKVKNATRDGLLGGASKVATSVPNSSASNIRIKVICVYTSDFDNTEDLTRIEQNIRQLGIINKLIYKFDKDIGKYKNQGYNKLGQAISLSDKYYELKKWLESNPKTEHISWCGKGNKGENKYCFRRLNMEKSKFYRKRIELERVGFYIEKSSEIEYEEIYFYC